MYIGANEVDRELKGFGKSEASYNYRSLLLLIHNNSLCHF